MLGTVGAKDYLVRLRRAGGRVFFVFRIGICRRADTPRNISGIVWFE